MGVGLIAGIRLGLVPDLAPFAPRVRPLGTLFLNLLSMVVVPLVATALFAGIAKLGQLRTVGRLVARTLGFFWATTVVAIVIGFTAGAAILPLGRMTPDKQATLREAAVTDSTFISRAAEGIPGSARFIVELIPANPVRAAAEGNLLPVIVFVTFLGLAAAALPPDKRMALTDLADGATDALIRVVHWVLLLAPIGIFALVFPIVAQFGWDLVKAMLAFVAAVIAGALVFIAAVYVPLTPRGFLRAAFPSMLMGFSTTSSLAALPTMLDAADRQLAIPRTIAGFALPLGASINRAGSALYQAVAVLFVAQLYGIPLGAGALFQAAAAVFLASLTVASVPSASVVSLLPAFTTIGLPIQGLSLLIGLDRIPDMFRTMTNVTGHLTAATVISAVESERQ
ncbi:MAG: dicarboxylate/amino acid:cation symporter [Gemmatimonadales bacterium]|nr:dicarboxylate/amino acid:cation symporter [Gemmatimonadales bacterium]